MAQENDVVLIHFEDKPMAFARIEEISADAKPNWYHIKLLLLQVPLQTVTWILRDTYINGREFTMSGKRMRLEEVHCPQETQKTEETAGPDQASAQEGPPKNGSNVISLARLKLKKKKTDPS